MKRRSPKPNPERTAKRAAQANRIRAIAIENARQRQLNQWVVDGDTASARGKNGLVCTIDAADLPLVKGLGLSFQVSKKNGPSVKVNEPIIQPLSHLLIGKPPHGMMVRYNDGNALNVRRSNISFEDYSVVGAGKIKQVGTTSRFKGVSFYRRYKCWSAAIRVKGVLRRLGNFQYEESAAEAYDAEAIRAWGDKAMTNRRLGLFDTKRLADRKPFFQAQEKPNKV